ncbi:MAG: polysaccharide deacetylase family protein [Proteobacteria bacterium]|nr:polysaccharide deacetylase family protein [Pseudomonadota bacterium]
MLRAWIAAAAVLMSASGAHAAERPRVAITVDDLPYAHGSPEPVTRTDAARATEINRVLLKAFKAHHAPAVGFVNQQTAERIGAPAGAHVLKAWTAPGFDLGNHLYAHDDTNALTTEQIEQQIMQGEPMIRDALARAGRKPRFLRFPFNHTGDTAAKHDAVAAFMATRGYRLAPCTIEAEDFAFNRPYELALKRRDQETAARIRKAYVDFTAAEIDWYAKLDSQVLGREAPHVMLLHASVLNRDAVSEVLALFEQRGFRFIALDEALKDSAYATPETVTKFGPMWGYRWARALGVKVRGQDEPERPAWVGQYAGG